MKKLLILLCLIPTWVFAQQAYPEGNMKREVRPGDNFMQYAVGGWIEQNPLKADEYENGAFKGCKDSVSARMSKILTELLVLPQKPGTTDEIASIIYKQFADTAQRNELGISPIQEELNAIRQAKDKEELQAVMARLYRRGGGTSLFQWGIRADMMHADSNIVAIGYYNFPIPPEYYKSHKRKVRNIRQAYQNYVCQLFEAAGYDALTAKVKMEQSYGLEKKCSKAIYVTWIEALRSKDFKNLVHKMTVAEMEQKYDEIAWSKVFETAHGPMDVRLVDVTTTNALKVANKILKESQLEELKSLAELQLLWKRKSFLTQDLRRQFRHLASTIQGETAEQAQWKINSDFLSDHLNMQMGQMYCQRYFDPAYKQRIQVMVNNICEAFRHRIEQNTWMTEETKQEALHKLDNIVWEIAYPDEWESLDGLQISKKNTLCENMARLQEFQWTREIERTLNQPVDRHAWNNGPQTVNAYNSLSLNRVTLPAGILQAPFFDPSADEAINYGAIGVVIAHELTHGYDPNGCQFDSIGNVHNWWTRKDKRAFSRRTKVLRRYFGGLKVGKDKVDGSLTLAENVADNGGLNIAFEAMQRAGINSTINGQTAAQRFFMGYARLWARNCRPNYQWFLIHNDAHAPSVTRVNGALPHIDAWYDAFGIAPTDSLYIRPDKRARIW